METEPQAESATLDASEVGLSPACPTNLLQAVDYAMRFNERGKPLGVRMRDDPAFMARRVVDHLARCGFVVLRKPPIKAHPTG